MQMSEVLGLDKYEYQVCADRIKALVKERRFKDAMDIADTIDWRRVKSFSMLCTVSEIYKITKHYSEARDILLLAYERYPDSANVVYALCELAIKLGDIQESIEYYKEYVHLKPNDTNKYALLYKIYDAQPDVPIEEKIALLEEYKREEYTERWAYELALLYHKVGQETRCVEVCDELALWFGEGTYVRKALELKMQHAPLTREQQQKYDGVYVKPVSTEEVTSSHQYEEPVATGTPEEQQVNKFSTRRPYSDILVKPVSTDKYSTINLQEELARNMEELYEKEKSDVAAPYYGTTSQLYEPSQEEFLSQLNQAGQGASEQGYYGAQDSYYGYGDGYGASSQGVYGDATTPAYDGVNSSTVASEPSTGMVDYSAPIMEENRVPEYAQSEGIVRATNPQPESVVTPHSVVPPVSENDAEANTIEKQITGQLDISDFMRELEAKKRDGQQQRKRQIMAKSLEHTSDILAQLEGRIPGIGNAVTETAVKKAEEEALKMPPIEEVIKDDKRGVVTRTTIPSPVFDRNTGSVPPLNVSTNSVPSSPEAIPDVLPSASDILPSGYRTTLEDEYGGEIARIRREEDEKYKRMTGELPPIEEVEPEEVEEPVIDYGEAEEIEEVEQPDYEDESESTEDESEVNEAGSIPPLRIDEEDDEADEVAEESDDEIEEDIEEDIEETDDTDEIEETEDFEDVREDDEEETESEVTGEDEDVASDDEIEDDDDIDESEEDSNETEDLEESEDSEEAVEYPYEVDDLGEAEEIEEVEQPEDIDAIIDSEEDEQLAKQYEDEIDDDDEDSRQYSRPSRSSRPSYMVMEESAKSRRDFDDSEIEIFGCYDGIEALKAQIVDAIDDMSMEAGHGNVVVMGSENFGRKSLAIDIVRAMQRLDSSFSGKVAKISGEALNKKNIRSTLSKLQNGALVVEEAGGLEPSTMNAITETLSSWDGMIFVVLEDEQEALENVLDNCYDTRSVFDSRIVINDFNDDDLVSYAKGYAMEEGYCIDDLGVLALHTRIAEMQSLEHKVTVDEAIEIVDYAIRHVNKKNMSHLMDVVLGKRYGKGDYIILREKDFLI